MIGERILATSSKGITTGASPIENPLELYLIQVNEHPIELLGLISGI